jgi:predicted ATPase
MWLVQMPSLVNGSERESLNREVSGATRERMLREMSDALEMLTADQPLVLILEDLHWSDYSTIDLISYLARQRHKAKLMLIGTYRPVELIISGHPLKAAKRELLAKEQCEELALEYLSREAVADYLSVRFPNNRFPAELSALIHARTDGNALFMVSAVNYLQCERLIAKHDAGWELSAKIENIELGVPDSIKQMIEKQLDHLDPHKQRLLEAASVAGEEFSAVAVVAALDNEQARVEAECDGLAREGQFLQDRGIQILPNGDVVTKYGFTHALYRSVLYDRVLPSRRAELHRRIGTQAEAAHGARAGEIAAELAMHFERGRDHKRAAKHLRKAAENALRRFAYHEAVSLARRGLELLGNLPESDERTEQELSMQLALGVPLIAVQGYAAPDVGRAYIRARELARQLPETPVASQVVWGLWTFHTLRAEFGASRPLAEELLHLGERLSNPTLEMRGHWAMEITYAHLGEFVPALEHFRKAVSLYDPTRHLDDGFVYALNPGVAMPCFASWALWFLGEPDQAVHQIQQALTLARTLSEPISLAHAFSFAAFLHQLRGEPDKTQMYAEMASAVSNQHRLTMYEAMATIMQGWSLVRQGAHSEVVNQMRAALASLQALDTKLVRPHFLALIVECLEGARQLEEGLPMLEEALGIVESNGERYYQAELYRLKGELLLAQSADLIAGRARIGNRDGGQPPEIANAEECFNRSREIAQQQKAKSLELRAVISLARLRQEQGQCAEARDLLAKTYDSFTEGFSTADLLEAKRLMSELK